jgi:chemotaxis protein methyltransferase CheR
MVKDLNLILNYLNENRGFDFSGYRPTMLERRAGQRFSSTKCETVQEYLHYLKENPDELDNLIDVLTINVSSFFRDTLSFEYIADKILPAIVHKKKETGDRSLRIWSSGCAMGEEPYSIAIMIHEFLEKEGLDFTVNIFATDIDKKVLKKAQKATYRSESIHNVKYRLLKKYFTSQGERFQLIPSIRDKVSFSVYDILAKTGYAPPESVFGDFDIVCCRNLLIYFDAEHQDLIFDKLYRSLSKHGYLVLGEVEAPSAKHMRCFKKVSECCHIYQEI